MSRPWSSVGKGLLGPFTAHHPWSQDRLKQNLSPGSWLQTPQILTPKPYYIDRETEVQRTEVIFPRLLSQMRPHCAFWSRLILGLHRALLSQWLTAPAQQDPHTCGKAVSKEAGQSPPWLHSSSMFKFSPRLGGCSKILKAVGHFGSSFSVVEAVRGSRDCLRFRNPFCLQGCCSGFPEKP